MPKSILVTKAKTAIIHSHISEELHERIRRVQAQLKAFGNDAVFPLDQIVEDALQRATRRAEAELSRRDAKSAPPPMTN